MGATNTEHYSDQLNGIANIAKALGHPARIAILQHLLSVEGCICGNIVDVLPISQPTVSQHLTALKKAGLIKGNIQGNSICYCINEDAINTFYQYIQTIKSKIVNKNNCC